MKPQNPMNFWNQGIHATLSDTGIDCNGKARQELLHMKNARSLYYQSAPEVVGVSVQAHYELISDMTCLRETLSCIQNALNQSYAIGKQIREMLDQLQCSHE